MNSVLIDHNIICLGLIYIVNALFVIMGAYTLMVVTLRLEKLAENQEEIMKMVTELAKDKGGQVEQQGFSTSVSLPPLFHALINNFVKPWQTQKPYDGISRWQQNIESSISRTQGTYTSNTEDSWQQVNEMLDDAFSEDITVQDSNITIVEEKPIEKSPIRTIETPTTRTIEPELNELTELAQGTVAVQEQTIPNNINYDELTQLSVKELRALCREAHINIYNFYGRGKHMRKNEMIAQLQKLR